MSHLIIKDLAYQYNATQVLSELNLNVEQDEIVCLLGASGCGKTTTLKAIAGILQPDQGYMSIDSKVVNDSGLFVAPEKRNIGMMFQDYALFPHLTVSDNIAFGLSNMSKAQKRERVDEMLSLVKLDGCAQRYPHQLSGGQQQRVALARALVVRPKCLLLDEPLSNLDAMLRLEMRTEIRRIVKEYGLTAVYVTHDQEEALSVADKIAVMRDGHIAQVGTPEEVYRHPRSKHVAEFIGATNFLSAEVDSVVHDDHRGYSVRAISSAGEIFQGYVTEPGWKPEAGDSVVVSVRPEALRFDDSGDVINQVYGKVIERVYQGATIQYLVQSDDGVYIQVSELNPRLLREPGQRIALTARQQDVVVLKPSAE